jgi:hypothetical protein
VAAEQTPTGTILAKPVVVPPRVLQFSRRGSRPRTRRRTLGGPACVFRLEG